MPRVVLSPELFILFVVENDLYPTFSASPEDLLFLGHQELVTVHSAYRIILGLLEYIE